MCSGGYRSPSSPTDSAEEAKTKGTLEPGKLADLVILDRNPLKVEPTAIKNITVIETIKEGRTVFTR